MTDRQIVLSKYPDAVLDYYQKSGTTGNAAVFWYRIIESRGQYHKMIGRSGTRSGAWRNARKNLNS